MNDEENRSEIDSNSNDDEIRRDLTSSVLFHGVVYIGSTNIFSPRSEDEIQRQMALLNEENHLSIDVTLCVPDNPDGSVRLIDPESEMEILSYRIRQILFCTRGPVESSICHCWAFTTSHSSTTSTEILYHSHVFRCSNQDAIYRILMSFANAFRRKTPNVVLPSVNTRRSTTFLSQALQATVGQLQTSNSNSNLNSLSSQQQNQFDGSVKFRTIFDIKEETFDSKGNSIINSVPRPEKNVFRLRKDLQKTIIVTLQQIRGVQLNIERCFGLLLAQGRNVPASDMQLLDLETMTKSDDQRYTIRAHWNPLARNFKPLVHLNEETSRAARIFFTVALDVVISGIDEPVRFLIEGKAFVVRQGKFNETSNQDATESIWSSFKKIPPFTEEFDLNLRQINRKKTNEQCYEVISLESKTQAERLAKARRLNSSSTNPIDDEIDETIVSGSGEVSKDCHEDILTNWNEILIKWKKNYSERPKGLKQLVQQGIPQALRCEVWQLLAESIVNENEMIEKYRILLTQKSSCERVIVNDLDRTFPSHEYFKTGATGQQSLYKISRAYSVRDEEVGYCQGLSFVIATLLIQIPEEQVFVLLCRMMEHPLYSLRELYKTHFENLQLKFYQLTRFIDEILPEISQHFSDLNIQTHMFASQWFLTLFTAKFPLYLVFRIIDLFLFDGFNAIFAVSLALLKSNQKDLLSLDFEGVMRFFRVNLPRKYLNENEADELIQISCSIKINEKKLKIYEKDFSMFRSEESEKETPLERLETENKRLTETCLRSELENEVLALELVNDRVQLKGNLDQAEDRIENLKEELEVTKTIVRQSEETTIRLNEELKYIRQVFQETCDELQQTQKMLEDSKQTCFFLNDQLIAEKTKIDEIQKNCCESCQILFNSPSSTPDDDQMFTEKSFYSGIVQRLQNVEIELAEKKLTLSEVLQENENLTHQLRQQSTMIRRNDSDLMQISTISSVDSMSSSSVSWLSKTVNTIKEATNSTNRTKVN